MTGDHNFTTFDEVIDFWAKERPDGPAFEQDGRITSYSQLDDITRRIITLLQQRGVAPGDRINWLGKNRDTYFMIYLAAARCGVVMVPIGWRLAPAEIAYIVEDTGSSLIFADDEFSGVARDVADRVTAKPEVLTVSQVEKLLPDQAQADYQPAGEHDPVLQLYTSGTTGNPKGAVLTNGNLLGLRNPALEAELPWQYYDAGDCMLVAMPCAHIGGTGW